MLSVEKAKRWSSEKAFVFATIAAAVGLGNLWRFPYIAGDNGGGAFVFAYIISIVILGLPLMMLEINAGRVERGSPVRTFRKIWKKASIFGWLVVGLTAIIMSYYLVITGWTLGFAIDSYTGNIDSFESFTSGYIPLLLFAIVTGITWYVVAKGIRAIEWLAKILMPILIAIVLGITAYSLTLEGAGEAIQFLFNPELSAMLDHNIWLLAAGQAFYSLAIGQGYLITYGSFLPKNTNLPRATGWVAGVESSIAIIAGLMMFPIVFTFGLNPGEGPELAFTTLPTAFEAMGFIGSTIAIFFFSLFFLAAISSCIAGMEVAKTAVKQEFDLTNKKAALYAFLPILPLGILSALSYTPMRVDLFGMPFLDALDLLAATQIVVSLGIIGGAIISWKIPKTHLVEGFGSENKRLAHWCVNISRLLPIPLAIILFMNIFF